MQNKWNEIFPGIKISISKTTLKSKTLQRKFLKNKMRKKIQKSLQASFK